MLIYITKEKITYQQIKDNTSISINLLYNNKNTTKHTKLMYEVLIG